jgi:hypothetical protein
MRGCGRLGSAAGAFDVFVADERLLSSEASAITARRCSASGGFDGARLTGSAIAEVPIASSIATKVCRDVMICSVALASVEELSFGALALKG